MNELLRGPIKTRCKITWSDPDTEKEIEQIAESAVPVMLYKLGISDPQFDFSEPGMEQFLFIEYCWMVYENAAANFDRDYFDAMTQCREKHLVAYYDEVKND